VRAYDTATGKILWRFDTAREFGTLNGVVAKGGAVGRNSIMIANGMVYVGSGFGKLPGNVLLAFSIGRDRQP
jgi:polyvinyl alcohol dehydrogenase (cytochrome)